MRNFAIVAGALVVLALGFVLATRSDEADAPTTSADVTTTETVTAEASTPPATASTEVSTTPEAAAQPAPAPKPAILTVRFANGEPEGGVRTLRFEKGEEVAFKVVSDVAEEIHVHGFDIYRDVAPGRSATFRFDAEFDGKYEIEMHDAAVQIASLEIQP
ncbi:MAG: hypothetical protein H0V81_09880 [Solirubrobacterales bacterium]|nr:hypothetical protein [Solirubrobacterales bacterium]